MLPATRDRAGHRPTIRGVLDPWAMRRTLGRAATRTSVVGGLALALVTLGACSEPHAGTDDFATGRARVVALLNEAGAVLPPAAGFEPVALTDTDRETCRDKVLGFAVGGSGTRQAQVPAIVELAGAGIDPDAAIEAIAAMWAERGYAIDRSGLDDERYPKLRARVDGYLVVATSNSDTPGFDDKPRVTLYAVSECLAG